VARDGWAAAIEGSVDSPALRRGRSALNEDLSEVSQDRDCAGYARDDNALFHCSDRPLSRPPLAMVEAGRMGAVSFSSELTALALQGSCNPRPNGRLRRLRAAKVEIRAATRTLEGRPTG